jgi:hypothetical protein
VQQLMGLELWTYCYFSLQPFIWKLQGHAVA